MDEKLVYTCGMKTYNYLIEPGDGTLYRFFYGVVPLGAQKMERPGAVIPDSYIVASGISEEPENWLLVGISMPSSVGLGVVGRDTLKHWPVKSSAFHNMTSVGHGFVYCDKYAVIAILFALKALVGGASIEVAAQEMMKASEEIGKYV